MQEKPKCSLCIELNDKYGTVPSCAECVPELLDVNVEPYKVYSLVSDQYIMGFNGAVSLNLVPVFDVMKLLEVKSPLRCIHLIKKAFYHMLEIQREKAKAKDGK